MKPPAIKIIIAIIVISCVIAILFIINAFLPKKEIILDQTNKIFIVKGDVKIKKATEGAVWQAMESATILEKDDIVETAENSTVDIIIGKNTDKVVKVEEKSRLEFEGINPASLNLPKGEVLIALKKLEPKSSFIVKTPTAVCGARGTGWLVEAKAEKTKICVFENTIFVQELGTGGRPKMKKYIASEGTKRTLVKNKPISESQEIEEDDLLTWKYWDKNIVFLREGNMLINDFNRKENFNNIGGAFGCWNVFVVDINQSCKDELTALERVGDSGYGLKLIYDVDSEFPAYNGFFTNLMHIDISEFKYLVFYVKGDKAAGFTTKLNLELKNNLQIGRAIIDGVTDEWKKIVTPLDHFTGINSFKDMKELVIVFSDLNATKKEGIIYIDDIYFSKSEQI